MQKHRKENHKENQHIAYKQKQQVLHLTCDKILI